MLKGGTRFFANSARQNCALCLYMGVAQRGTLGLQLFHAFSYKVRKSCRVMFGNSLKVLVFSPSRLWQMLEIWRHHLLTHLQPVSEYGIIILISKCSLWRQMATIRALKYLKMTLRKEKTLEKTVLAVYMITLLCGSQTWILSTPLIISNFCIRKDAPRMNSGSWTAQLIDKFAIREKKRVNRNDLWCRNALGVCVTQPEILLGLNVFKWPGTADKCLKILAALTRIISWGKVTVIKLISLMWI